MVQFILTTTVHMPSFIFSSFYQMLQKVYLGCHLVIALLAFLLVILPVEI
jgi:hypothetical protein